MATKKKLLQAAAGAGGAEPGLNVEQVFSTYIYQGNGSGVAVDNGINLGQSYGSGSVYFNDPNADYPIPLSSTISFGSSDSWTVEAWVCRADESGNAVIIANDYGVNGTGNQITVNASTDYLSYYDNQSVLIATSQPVSMGTWYHVAFVKAGSDILYWVNGVSAGTRVSSQAADFKTIGALGGYTAGASWWGWMADLRVSNYARYTSAFTPPTSALTTDANTVLLCLQSDDPFTDKTGNRTLSPDYSRVSTSTFGPFDATEAGEGGLVWIKNRDDTDDHYLGDSERGFSRRLESNNTDAQVNNANGPWTFNASGFSIPNFSQVNTNGEDYVSWTFRKAPKFFDVVTYTGNGTANHVINHNLGVKPAVIILKQTDGVRDWLVLYDVVDGSVDYMKLNDTVAAADGSSVLSMTSTDFTLIGTGNTINGSGLNYVAYLFAHNDGDGEFGPTGDQDIIKCGTYTGNASDNGPTINLGFEPQWLLIKNATGGTNSWWITDTVRGFSYNYGGGVASDPRDKFQRANFAGVEDSYNLVGPTSTGFQLETADGAVNGSGVTYIYIAIRKGPMEIPTSGRDVFNTFIPLVNGSSLTDYPYWLSNFTVDMALHRHNAISDSAHHFIIDRVRGQGKALLPSTADNEVTASGATYYPSFVSGMFLDSQTGIKTNVGYGAGGTSIDVLHMWKRAPSFFDIVAYNGTGVAGHTVSHNLGVAPEMMWVKRRDGSANWLVYHKDVGAGYYGVLSGSNVFDPSNNAWNSTAPTDTEFTLGVFSNVNVEGGEYVAYLFASLDGVSKVGSYTGTGATLNIDCGFSSGARFVLLKRTDSIGNWRLFDTERGIVAGNDALLNLDTNNPQESFDDLIDPYSSGFTLTSSGMVNTSGGSYIFYAIA